MLAALSKTEEDADRADRGRDAGGESDAAPGHREIEHGGWPALFRRQKLERRRTFVLCKRVVERVAVGDQTGIVEVVEDTRRKYRR